MIKTKKKLRPFTNDPFLAWVFEFWGLFLKLTLVGKINFFQPRIVLKKKHDKNA